VHGGEEVDDQVVALGGGKVQASTQVVVSGVERCTGGEQRLDDVSIARARGFA
jgi:hypothetical protein